MEELKNKLKKVNKFKYLLKKEGKMITSSLKGIFLEKTRVKQEFLSLIKGV